MIALRRTEPDLADPWLEHLVVDYDEEKAWVVMRRGAISIACNTGANAVAVPATGELLAAWGEPTLAASHTTLEGHSFAILKNE